MYYYIELILQILIKGSKGTKDDDQSKIHSVGKQNDT